MGKSALVIGAGFGGLSAAIRLQAAGVQTTLLEKGSQVGGRARVFRESGFVFDAGPTVITAPECLDELFALTGRKLSDYVELISLSPFYRLHWGDGSSFDYSNNSEEMARQIGERNPRDVEGYEKFLEYSKKVYQKGYVELGHAAFLKFRDMIKVSPALIRAGAHRSVFQVVSKYIKDPKLREAFSFHTLLVGGSPFKSSSIYTLIHYLERSGGVHFPKGGTGALVQGMLKYFRDLGGMVRTDAEVGQITVRDGVARGVSLKSGEQLNADLVVSNAEVMHTYKNLLSEAPQAGRITRQLHRRKFTMSLFVMYLGSSRSAASWPKLAHHNIIFGQRYKELLKDIFEGHTLPDDFSLYVHAPSVTDPSMAPEGCSSYYVLSPVPHLGHLPIDWNREAPIYAEKIFNALEKSLMPGLRESLMVQKYVTPDYFNTELNSHLGAAFSLQPTLLQSAYFRIHNRDRNIRGLYFVGAGTHPGAGIPGVVGSAKATVGVIQSDGFF